MKATEVIEQYKNGQRNFRNLNLQGANFKGQDLSGADFSYCQIQSANFSQANLTNTKFIGAKAGLQKRWVIGLLLLVLVLIAFSSFFSADVGHLVYQISDSSHADTQVKGWASLITLVVVCVITYHQNLKAGLIAGTVVVAVAAVVAKAFTGVVAGAFIAAIAIAVAGAVAGVVIVGGVVIAAATITVVGAGAKAFAMAVAVALVLFACFIGYRTLKDETTDPWLRRIAVACAAIGGTSFYSAIVTDADFRGATLKNTNFNQAILIRTCFKNTVELNLAQPGNTLLANHKVRDLLINPSTGEKKDFREANLRGAYLTKANLKKANLQQADISEATFHYANLSDANLTEVNAVQTDFTNAYLTGVCLENWNIDATTKLNNVDCQYVYLLNKEKERRPSSGDFKPGEFSKLFEEVFDTVDLIFENGINWKSFVETMKTVQVQNKDTPLEVSSIENKGDGVFVVKVKVPPDADKEKIHKQFEENYQLKLAAVEADYKRLLAEKEIEHKDAIIEIYRQNSASMKNIVETQASRPITVEAIAMTDSKNTEIHEIINSGVINFGNIIGDTQNIINQIPENQDKQGINLKQLVQELTTAIEDENTLDYDDKAEAANQVKKIAQAIQNPDNESLQNKAKRAVSFLEIIAKGLEPASKLAKACKTALPVIITFLGL